MSSIGHVKHAQRKSLLFAEPKLIMEPLKKIRGTARLGELPIEDIAAPSGRAPGRRINGCLRRCSGQPQLRPCRPYGFSLMIVAVTMLSSITPFRPGTVQKPSSVGIPLCTRNGFT